MQERRYISSDDSSWCCRSLKIRVFVCVVCLYLLGSTVWQGCSLLNFPSLAAHLLSSAVAQRKQHHLSQQSKFLRKIGQSVPCPARRSLSFSNFRGLYSEGRESSFSMNNRCSAEIRCHTRQVGHLQVRHLQWPVRFLEREPAVFGQLGGVRS